MKSISYVVGIITDINKMEKIMKRAEITICLVLATLAILLSICSFAGLAMTGGWWLLIMGIGALWFAVALIKESFKIAIR